MKTKFLIVILFVHCIVLSVYSQSSSFDPDNGFEDIMDGRSLNHTDGSIRFGIYNLGNRSYLQTHSNHPLYFGTNNTASPKIVLALNGNLGINFPDGFFPSEKLEIKNGGISFNGWENNSKPGGIVFTNDAGSEEKVFMGYASPSNIYGGLALRSFTTNSDEVTFRDNGEPRLGVGQTSPITTLDVNGEIRLNALSGTKRALILINTSSTFVKSISSPTISIAPSSFTMCESGNMADSNLGFLPSSTVPSSWIPIDIYHFVEKALSLPNGATLKNIVAYMTDNDTNNRMSTCLNIINSSTGATNSYCAVTNVNSPNNLPYSFNSDLDTIVDNAQYSYVLRVESINNASGSGVWKANMGFGVIKIDMTY